MPPASGSPLEMPTHVRVVLTLGILSFCFSPILVRYASEAPALAVAVWRTLFAVLFLLPFLRTAHLKRYARLSAAEYGRITAAGILLGVHFYLFFESLYNTTVASTTMFVALSPVFMAAIGFVVLKERLTPAVLAGIAIATLGGAMIAMGDATTGSAPNPAWGNLLGVAASFALSIYLVIGRVARQGMDWLTYVFPLYALCALTVLALALAAGVTLTGYPPKIYGISALLALGPQILGHGSFNLSVRYLSAAVLGLLSLTEPVGASALAWLLFDETPAAVSIAGMVVALAGVGLALAPGLFRKTR
ncbi:MAG: DMT family transporter [Rhodothermales bacterium]